MKRSILWVLGNLLLFVAGAEGTTLHVDCRPGALGKLKTIGAAIAKITAHPSVSPYVVKVTGACNENVSVVFLDNITLQASSAGAFINDASGGTADTVFVLGSRNFFMNNFTINGSMSCTNDAVCYTSYNTFQNGGQFGWGIRYSRSHGDSTDDVIQNSSGNGVTVQNASEVLLADSIVRNNAGEGIYVGDAAYLILTNQQTTTTITNNGDNGVLVSDHATVRLEVANVTGNSNNGVLLQDSSLLRMDYASPAVNNVTGNGSAGVLVGDQSFAFFPDDGSANVTGNLGGTDVQCAGRFPATRGALTNLGGGTTNCKEAAPLAKPSKGTPQEKTDTKSPQ